MNYSPKCQSPVELTGWLVIVDGVLCFLCKEANSGNKEMMKLKIKNQDIVYVVRDKVVPLGGGESFVCHESVVIGYIDDGSVDVIHLRLREQVLSMDMFEIDVSENQIELMRGKYEKILAFNFFKEIGDC